MPTILFGWYCFFFLSILFIVMLEAIRIVLPELLHGETLTPDVSIGEGVSTDPQSAREGIRENDDAASGSE